MSDLRDPLDDLLADVPAYVVPDARAAWAAGARRRVRGRLVLAGAAAALVAVVLSLVAWLPQADRLPPATSGSGATGYPARVDKPWFEHDLPDRAGPLAGVLVLEDGSWRAVSPSGQVWRIPHGVAGLGNPLALAADGTSLAYLENGHRFVLRDLVAGTWDVADGVGDGTRSDAYLVAGQAPGFWSPDGDRVFIAGSATDSRGPEALLVGAGNGTVAVPAPRVRAGGAAWPAGWTPDGDLVWFAGDFQHNHARWAQAVVTTTAGAEIRRLDLSLGRHFGMVSQWSGSTSPDASRILVSGSGAPALLFSLADGSRTDRVDVEFPDLCPMSWSGEEPRPTYEGSNIVAVRHGDGTPQIVVDPAITATCGTWASDALAGQAHQGVGGHLFGDDVDWLSWHWQEVIVGALAAVALVVPVLLVLVRRRRRRRLAPTS